MAVITSILNGLNLNRDENFARLTTYLMSAGVRTGKDNELEITTNQCDTGEAWVTATRDNVTPNETFLVNVKVTSAETIDTSGTGYIIIRLSDSKVNDGSANAVDGSGIATIENVAALPSKNYLVLATLASGVITDARTYANIDSNLLESLFGFTTAGDIIGFDGSNFDVLPIGTPNDVLSVSAAPSNKLLWKSVVSLVGLVHNGAGTLPATMTAETTNTAHGEYTDDPNYIFSASGTTFKILSIDDGVNEERNTTSDWALTDDINGIVKLGDYIYVLLYDAGTTTSRVYRYSKTDLAAGGTLMTHAFFGTSAAFGMSHDGTNFLFTCDAGNDAVNSHEIRRASLSGTTLTSVDTITCGADANAFKIAFCGDGTNIYTIDQSPYEIRRFNYSGVLQASTVGDGIIYDLWNANGELYLNSSGNFISMPNF